MQSRGYLMQSPLLVQSRRHANQTWEPAGPHPHAPRQPAIRPRGYRRQAAPPPCCFTPCHHQRPAAAGAVLSSSMSLLTAATTCPWLLGTDDSQSPFWPLRHLCLLERLLQCLAHDIGVVCQNSSQLLDHLSRDVLPGSGAQAPGSQQSNGAMHLSFLLDPIPNGMLCYQVKCGAIEHGGMRHAEAT